MPIDNMPQEKLFHTSKKFRNFAQDDLSQHEQSQSYVQCKSDLPLFYRTIGQHLKLAADKYPNNVALVSCHEGLRYTYTEVLDKVNRMAAAFYEIGLEKGDRIGVWAPNNWSYYLATLAAARAGMISVGINPAYQIPELEYALKKVDVKALVMAESFRTRNYYDSLKELVPELMNDNPGQLKSERVPSLASVIIDSEQSYPGTFSVEYLLNLPNEQQVAQIESIQPNIGPDSGACLLYTSGTTGNPKAALISHFGLVNNGSQGAYRNRLDTGEHRVCVQVPLFHAFGLAMGLVSCMNYGSTLVMPGAAFKASESLDAIVKERCTVMYGTPTMYVDLLAEFRKRKNVSIPQMELAMFGAAACSPKLMLDVQEVMGVRRVLAGYGMTETSCATFICDREDTTETAMGSVGRIIDHSEAKVVDRSGKIVPFGTPGELLIRGYGNMLGYWGEERKTKEVIGSDRWLKTGDQFVLQPNGYGKVVGRIKELIIRGGENIYPKEIEDVLNTIPGILESHCIGVPDERLGEEVCAYVRVDASVEGQVNLAGIKEFCKSKLAHFKIPKHLRVVDQLPKTTTGKIQKFKLFEMFLSENKENKV